MRGAVPGLGEQRVQGLRGDAWHPGVVHAPKTRAPDMTLREASTLFQKRQVQAEHAWPGASEFGLTSLL